MADRFDTLSPRDTAITLRSLPRRVGDLVNQVLKSSDLSLRVDAKGPSTQSLSDLVDEASRTQSLLHNELNKSLDHQEPVIAAATFVPEQRHFVEARPVPVTVGLACFKDEVEASAKRIEAAQASALSRTVRVVGDSTTTPLAIAQEAARCGISTLTLLEQHVSWMRDTRPRG